MYDEYQSRSRDDGSYRRSDSRRRDRDDDDFYRSRKGKPETPGGSLDLAAVF